MKKLGTIAIGLSVVGVLSFGLNNSFETQQATHADHFISKPGLNIGDTPVTAYSHGDTWSPADNGGDTPAPTNIHGEA